VELIFFFFFSQQVRRDIVHMAEVLRRRGQQPEREISGCWWSQEELCQVRQRKTCSQRQDTTLNVANINSKIRLTI
jgi:hypothetical protein